MTKSPDLVERRCVFFFGGYENVSAERQYRRLTRELDRFAATWRIQTQAGEPVAGERSFAPAWRIDTKGPNWRVETEFHYCAWNDLIDEDFAQPDWRAIPTGLASLADFVLTGTAFRYLAVAWRYGLFFAYALLAVAVCAAAAWLVVGVPGRLGLPLPWPAAIPAGIAVFWGLLRWPGERFHVRYMLNDWSFASAVAWRRRRSYGTRIEAFSRHIAETVRRTDADEVLIVGHSLGAVLATEALAGALEHDGALARRGTPVTLMTVGSSLLKVGLHPAARALRGAVKRVLDATEIAWVDYTALVDVLNFYRADPRRALRLEAARSPVLRTVKLRAMLGEPAYQQFSRNFLRLHRQFVMGNGARYHYDFFMSCCGPMSQASRIENPTLSVENFGADGTYLPAAGRDNGARRSAGVRR